MYLAPTPLVTSTLAGIAPGFRGVAQTIAHMRALVNQYKVNPEIIQRAISIVYLTPPKNEHRELEALFNSVRDNIRYLRDVHNVETLSDPLTTINRKVGDCDDKSVLLATLAESIGYPSRFVVAGYKPEKNYEHVYLQLWANNQWIDADPTENKPLGWFPPNETIIAFESV